MLGEKNIWCGMVDPVLVIFPDRNHQGDHGLLVEVVLSCCLNAPLHHRLAVGQGCVHVADIKGGDCGVLIHLRGYLLKAEMTKHLRQCSC